MAIYIPQISSERISCLDCQLQMFPTHLLALVRRQLPGGRQSIPDLTSIHSMIRQLVKPILDIVHILAVFCTFQADEKM
jgi:hypothetical protein